MDGLTIRAHDNRLGGGETERQRLDQIALEIRIKWTKARSEIAGIRTLLEEARDLCRSRRESFDEWCKSGKLGIHKTQIYNFLKGRSSSHVHPVDVLHENTVLRPQGAAREKMADDEDDEDELLNIFMELQNNKREVGCSSQGKSRQPFYDSIKKETTTCEWYTAKYIFDALDTLFQLDPASPGSNIVPWLPADRHFTINDDGLTQLWGEDFVWLNAPFGRNRLILWTRKFIEHGNGVILVPERSSTRWYQELEVACDLMLHMDKKVPFIDQDGETRKQFPIGTHMLAIGKKGREALIRAHHNGLGRLSKSFTPGK